MRILVTGATGFIGSHLMEDLALTLHNVLGIDMVPGYMVEGMEYKIVDLRDYEASEKVIMDFEPEVVFHLAANSRESTGEHSPIDMITSGYNTFFTTLTASIKGRSLKKFIYISSAAVYGNVRTPYTEKQLPQPNDIYAVTKYANELALRIMANTYKFSYVIVRPHNVTGERQDPRDLTRNVIPMFMQLLRLGRKPKIFGDGSSVRCYTYVKDLTKILVKCLTLDKVTINVGSDTPTSIKELYDVIVEVSGINTEPEYCPARTNEVDINIVDHAQAKQSISGYPNTPFLDIIRKTWEWVSQQPLQDFKPVKREIEL